jgi:hypothetical protein
MPHLFNNLRSTAKVSRQYTQNLFLKGNTMSNPQQGTNEAPKPANPQQQTQNPGSPQQQGQNPGSPKPTDKQPNEQQK